MQFSLPGVPPRFRVIRRIGAGAMGAVYEAVDVEQNEPVALKTIHRRDADLVTRIKHEFRALRDVHHPNLVALRELVADRGGEGDEDGREGDVFFTMELVEGVDLLTWVRGEPPAPPAQAASPEDDTLVGGLSTADRTGGDGGDALPAPGAFDEARLRDALRQIASGLSALHGAGKVHRDIKPSNILVTPAGRVVLLDFGLVTDAYDPDAGEDSAAGTPGYMAPEQASPASVGPEADWYALGAVLYECLTGHRPFEGLPGAVLLVKRRFDPPLPSTRAPDVPRDLESLCMDLLRRHPHARPTGAEVRARLS